MRYYIVVVTTKDLGPPAEPATVSPARGNYSGSANQVLGSAFFPPIPQHNSPSARLLVQASSIAQLIQGLQKCYGNLLRSVLHASSLSEVAFYSCQLIIRYTANFLMPTHSRYARSDTSIAGNMCAKKVDVATRCKNSPRGLDVPNGEL